MANWQAVYQAVHIRRKRWVTFYIAMGVLVLMGTGCSAFIGLFEVIRLLSGESVSFTGLFAFVVSCLGIYFIGSYIYRYQKEQPIVYTGRVVKSGWRFVNRSIARRMHPYAIELDISEAFYLTADGEQIPAPHKLGMQTIWADNKVHDLVQVDQEITVACMMDGDIVFEYIPNAPSTESLIKIGA